MAMARRSPRITTQIVGVKEYPGLTSSYKVTLLPKIWVNDIVYIDGAAREQAKVEKILLRMMEQALDPDTGKEKRYQAKKE